MNYEETLDYLFTKLPMYQREGKVAFKKDLTNTIVLLEALDNPHKKFKSVHIAGTNGKGTCAHGISAIMQHAGYKVGLYTSPHLKNFTERIRINGVEIEERFVVDFVKRIQSQIASIAPSFFEITVAMAFAYFAEEQVDIAIIETGLGGRLDSTNVIHPEACLITNIGYDHMDMLGDTLPQIASEKAGIIKRGVPVVIGQYQEEVFSVFAEKARKERARLIVDHNFGWGTYPSDYPYHKQVNHPSVRTLALLLRDLGWEISSDNIQQGFDQMEELTGLKGRYQILQNKPLKIADVSHNPEGLAILFRQVSNKVAKLGGTLHLIFGAVKGKDVASAFALFPKECMIYWTQSSVPRSLAVKDLARMGKENGLTGALYQDVNQAIDQAAQAALPQDIILITGSTFVVAEVEEL